MGRLLLTFVQSFILLHYFLKLYLLMLPNTIIGTHGHTVILMLSVGGRGFGVVFF